MSDIETPELQVIVIDDFMVPVWQAVKSAAENLRNHRLYMAPTGAIAVNVDERGLVMAAAFEEDTRHMIPTAEDMAVRSGPSPSHPRQFIGRQGDNGITVGYCMIGGSYDPAIISFVLALTRAQLNEQCWRAGRTRYVVVE